MNDYRDLAVENASLRSRLSALEAAHAKVGARIHELEEQNMNLVQLTVASQLLSGVSERDAVLAAIEEIVVNMVGSEEVAIFEVHSDDGRLVLARARGIDVASTRFACARESLARAVRSGDVVAPGDHTFTAAIPLKVEQSVLGLVAIFRLLEQKPALDATDHELFDLLSRQAALALYSSAFRHMRPTVRPPQHRR